MCEMNKNHLLDFFFGEVTDKEKKKIQDHIQLCPRCREYLGVLEQTRDRLQQLPLEKTQADSMDQIMKNIAGTAKRQAEIKPGSHLVPLLWIPLTAITILIAISLVKDNLAGFSIWQPLKNFWIIQQLGSFGMTAVLFFLTGILITLLVTPILIFESKNNQYRFTI